MLRNILTAALVLFVAMACETYSPNPARRDPGEGKEVTVNVNVPSAPASHSDATADAAAPATDSGESPEADAGTHHPNPGQGGHADAEVTEADAEVVNVEPDAAAETPDAAEPHQAPDSDVVDQAPDAAAPVGPREICVQVRAACSLFAASSSEVNANGDPTVGIHLIPSQRFCFDPTTESAVVNVQTDRVDENGNLMYGLSVTSMNEAGDWCSNATGRNVRRDVSCFMSLTPEQLGFEEHCTNRDGADTLNWLWRAENLAD